jgi:hypothetical protein
MKISRFIILRPPARSGLNYQIRIRSKIAGLRLGTLIAFVAEDTRNTGNIHSPVEPRPSHEKRAGSAHTQW